MERFSKTTILFISLLTGILLTASVCSAAHRELHPSSLAGASLELEGEAVEHHQHHQNTPSTPLDQDCCVHWVASAKEFKSTLQSVEPQVVLSWLALFPPTLLPQTRAGSHRLPAVPLPPPQTLLERKTSFLC